MIGPRFQINLNGDRFEDMHDQLSMLDDKLRPFEAAMSVFTIHGRNYQTKADPVGDHRADIEGFREALKHLNSVRDWLDSHRLHLEDQRPQ